MPSLTANITPAPLTVTADDKSKVAGQSNPPLTYTVTGYVNAETASVLTGSPVLNTAATGSSPAGS